MKTIANQKQLAIYEVSLKALSLNDIINNAEKRYYIKHSERIWNGD
jgi:hypothetical protein